MVRQCDTKNQGGKCRFHAVRRGQIIQPQLNNSASNAAQHKFSMKKTSVEQIMVLASLMVSLVFIFKNGMILRNGKCCGPRTLSNGKISSRWRFFPPLLLCCLEPLQSKDTPHLAVSSACSAELFSERARVTKKNENKNEADLFVSYSLSLLQRSHSSSVR